MTLADEEAFIISMFTRHMVVDGITSTADLGDYHIQPMFQIIDDLAQPEAARSNQYPSRPTTEEELREWINTGEDPERQQRRLAGEA